MFNYKMHSDEELSELSDFEAEFQRKSKTMYELFPNLPFVHDTEDLDILDEPLVKSKTAVIFYPLKCYCCCPDREGAVVIPINRDRYITRRDFYEECEKHWGVKEDDMCNHRFLEGFEIKSETQIEPCFGS